jgi:hypothetical protein
LRSLQRECEAILRQTSCREEYVELIARQWEKLQSWAAEMRRELAFQPREWGLDGDGIGAFWGAIVPEEGN